MERKLCSNCGIQYNLGVDEFDCPVCKAENSMVLAKDYWYCYACKTTHDNLIQMKFYGDNEPMCDYGIDKIEGKCE
jgi:hypothetical protein